MLLSKSFVFCNVLYVAVIIFRKCNMTSNLYVDFMSLLKQVITTIFYIIMIEIEFIIMTDRYYVSCHVKVLHAGNFLREKLLLHILLLIEHVNNPLQNMSITLYFADNMSTNNNQTALQFKTKIDRILLLHYFLVFLLFYFLWYKLHFLNLPKQSLK